MTRFPIIISLATVTLLFSLSCGDKKKKKGNPAPPTPPPSDSADATAGNEMLAIVQKYCVSCHGESEPSGGLDLSTNEAITTNGSAIVTAIEDGTMPGDGRQLTAQELLIVSAWKDSGFPAPGADDGSNPDRDNPDGCTYGKKKKKKKKKKKNEDDEDKKKDKDKDEDQPDDDSDEDEDPKQDEKC